MTDKRVLICYRVADLAEAPPASSIVAQCAACGAAVWMALSSPDADEIICMHCLPQSLSRDKAEGRPLEFEKPTDEQLKELRDYYNIK